MSSSSAAASTKSGLPTVSLQTHVSVVSPHTKTSTQTRPRTPLERQPYLFAYGAAISTFSPIATAYQLTRLYKVNVPTPQLFRLSASVFPHQCLLKVAQMNASTPVKEYCSPWAAFAAVGVLQGGVYGQANVAFSRALHLTKTTASFAGIFRGSGFAALRDTLSQGVPFMYSDSVRTNVLDRVWPTDQDNATAQSIKQWTSVLSTSVVATYLSQGLHNAQMTLQADQSLSYGQAVRTVWQQHGLAGFVRGAEARVGLLLVVNVLNELLLKPAWADVPV